MAMQPVQTGSPPVDQRWFPTRWASSAVSGIFADTMDRATQKAPELIKPFQEIIDQSATTVHPIFIPLRTSISSLVRILQTQQKPPEKAYSQILQLLQPFNSGRVEGYFRRLDMDVITPQMRVLYDFEQRLVAKNVDLPQTLNALHAINILYHHETGKIGTVLDNFFQTIAAEGRSAVSNLFSSGTAAAPPSEAQPVLDKFFSQPHARALPKIVVDERMLLAQADLLVESAVQVAVAAAILPVSSNPIELTTKAQIFAKIEEIHPGVIGQWRAKLKYYALILPVRFYISHSISNVLNYAVDVIEKGAHDNYQSLSRTIMQFFHAQFATINGAYGYIAEHRREAYGTIATMMKARLEEKALNRGKTTKQINANFANAFIDRFIPRFEWCAQLKHLFGSVRVTSGNHLDILNPFIGLVMSTFSLVARIVIFPFEAILNTVTIAIVKSVVANLKVVEKIREGGRDAFLGQNYAHTLNVLTRDALAEALDKMRAPVKKEKQGGENNKALAAATLNELDGLASNFLKTLQLHKERDLSNLEALVKDGTLIDRVTMGLSEITGRTVNPTRAIIEAIGEELSAVSTTLMNKNLFYNFMYAALTNLNEGIFSRKPEVSEEEQMAVEGEMVYLLSTIVTKAARDALHAQLAPKAPAAGKAHTLIEKLHQSTAAFADAFDDNFFEQIQTGILDQAISPILLMHDRSRQELQKLLTHAEGSHHHDQTVLEVLRKRIADRAAIQMLLIEALQHMKPDGDNSALVASVKEQVRQLHAQMADAPLDELPAEAGIDFTRWENDIFQVVRGFLATRAEEIPGLLKEPFLLSKLANGAFLWFSTGKVEEGRSRF